jgi:hypothetical protein
MPTFALLLSACGSEGDDSGSSSDATSNDISGSVSEWKVDVDDTAAEAGTVTFTIANDGTTGHEFLIVKTDIAPGEIPVDGNTFPERSTVADRNVHRSEYNDAAGLGLRFGTGTTYRTWG